MPRLRDGGRSHLSGTIVSETLGIRNVHERSPDVAATIHENSRTSGLDGLAHPVKHLPGNGGQRVEDRGTTFENSHPPMLR